MGLSSGELLLSGFLCLRIEGIILLEFYDFVIKNFFFMYQDATVKFT